MAETINNSNAENSLANDYGDMAYERLLKAEKALAEKSYIIAQENFEIGIFLIESNSDRDVTEDMRYRLTKGYLRTKQINRNCDIENDRSYFSYAINYADKNNHQKDFYELYLGAWEYLIATNKYEFAIEITQGLVHGLTKEQYPERWKLADYLKGMCLYMLGDVKESKQYAVRALEDYHGEVENDFLQGVHLLAKSLMMLVEWTLGNYQVIEILESDILDDLVKCSNNQIKVITLFALSLHSYNKRDYKHLYYYSDILYHIAVEENRQVYIIMAKMLNYWSNYFLNKKTSEIALIKKNYNEYCNDIGNSNFISTLYVMMLSDICIDTGNYNQGLNLLNYRMEKSIFEKDCLYESELYRYKGELSYLMERNRMKALTYYNKGIKLARENDLKSFEWRIKDSSRKLMFV